MFNSLLLLRILQVSFVHRLTVCVCMAAGVLSGIRMPRIKDASLIAMEEAMNKNAFIWLGHCDIKEIREQGKHTHASICSRYAQCDHSVSLLVGGN
jgi:hypothetical protein